MLRSFVALLCLSVVAWGTRVPRPLDYIPIQTVEKKPIDLKKYRGKVVFMILFLTDCADCIEMINFASKLQTQYGARGFQVVGAAVDYNAPYVLTPFIQRYRPTFPIGFMTKPEEIVKFLDYTPSAPPIAPMIMFIDSDGNVRFQYTGKDTEFVKNQKTLRIIAEGLLNQKEGKHEEYKGPK